MAEDVTPTEFNKLMEDAASTKRAMIILFQDADGNWRGSYMKTGSEIPTFARQVGPDTVLQMLLTDDK